ncbi:AMP-binding protein [Variovorax sp. 770b2]|uniref:AMP-binding protein n=1 Tax=Variovorax sp. 770b2 TaxID=1566271 RepID=UPI0008EAB4B8|nr:AMP-binding protein [Variovorax sp. 770b2]SFQ40602.1 crotonobetaine/carnitine-CoA ligase [Variovorax sp. 770b2]
MTIELPHLARLICDRAASTDGAPLITFVSLLADGDYATTTRSYKSLWSNGQRLARAMAVQGMKSGDRFALLMQNQAEFVDAMVASAILGTVLVPIDPRTKGNKLQYMLDSVACKGAIVGAYVLGTFEEIRPQLKSLEWTWVVGQVATRPSLAGANARWLDECLTAQGEEIAIANEDVDVTMQLVFTSGTTGDPKAIVGSYRKYASIGQLAPAMGIRSVSDRMYTGLSLTHSNAQAITLSGTLHNGIPTVISQTFSKSRLWSIVRDFGCTTLNLLGGMFNAIYSEMPSVRDADNPIRIVIGSGVGKTLWGPFEERFGLKILEIYGTAEGGCIIKPPGVGPIGSIGKAIPGLIAHIFDEDDKECPPNEPGEIVFETADGDSLSVTYLGNEKASEEKTRGGLLRSGDIGYRDEEGWYFFMHRKGGELRRNGEFIAPGFVEKEIAEHADVTDVFVYGVLSANSTPGEKDLVAAIVPRPGCTWRAEEIFDWCASRLERNSIPSYLQVVDEIPKTASEKPIERLLAQSFDVSASNVFRQVAAI